MTFYTHAVLKLPSHTALWSSCLAGITKKLHPFWYWKTVIPYTSKLHTPLNVIIIKPKDELWVSRESDVAFYTTPTAFLSNKTCSNDIINMPVRARNYLVVFARVEVEFLPCVTNFLLYSKQVITIKAKDELQVSRESDVVFYTTPTAFFPIKDV